MNAHSDEAINLPALLQHQQLPCVGNCSHCGGRVFCALSDGSTSHFVGNRGSTLIHCDRSPVDHIETWQDARAHVHRDHVGIGGRIGRHPLSCAPHTGDPKDQGRTNAILEAATKAIHCVATANAACKSLSSVPGHRSAHISSAAALHHAVYRPIRVPALEQCICKPTPSQFHASARACSKCRLATLPSAPGQPATQCH